MSLSTESAAARSEARELARSGLITFAGSAVSALMGFAFTVVLARSLGDLGSGVVLQVVGIFAIVTSITKVGMDSVAVWLMPRLADAGVEVRGSLVFMMAVTAAFSAVGGVVLAALGRSWPGKGPGSDALGQSLELVAWFLPAGALVMVALAATRGLGGVVPYVAVGAVGLPTVRPVVVAVVAAAGATAVGAAVAWAAPLPVALGLAAVVLRVQVRRHEGAAGARGGWWPSRERMRTIAGYALPRTISAALEQSILWLDVVVVGAVAGSAAAGVYGGASRFVAAGLIVDNALRLVVSPRFSALLHAGRLRDVQHLYRTAATWLILFSTPIYLLLAAFGPTVMGWLGDGFESGAPVLVVLGAGATVALAAGNIHSVLLMSGHSGWAAINKVVVLSVNVACNLLLVPRWGIIGAASVWAVSMVLDAAMATVEVRRLIGVTVEGRGIAYALVVPLVTVGVPAVAIRLVWGSTTVGLAMATVAGGLALLLWCVVDRRRLRLHDLMPAASPAEIGTRTGENRTQRP